MAKTIDFDEAFKASTIDKKQLRVFIDQLAKFEADSGFTPIKALINGIPPFQEVVGATFKVPRKQIPSAIEKLLQFTDLNPDIIINGKPGLESLEITIGHG